MNKQKMRKLHRQVCRGKVIPYEDYDDYMNYVEQIAPKIDTFKSVSFSKTRDMLRSKLLNEISKPAGIRFIQIPNWWG